MAIRISKKTWLILAILIIAVIVLGGIALSCSSSSPSEALNFTLPTLTGANITLSEMEGTPVVLNFWSTSCPYCVQQLPYLENVAQESGGDIKVIAINVGQPISEVERFFGDYEPTMIVALDENREVFVNYCQNYDNTRGYIPFTLFVDSEGVVQYKKIGAFSSEAQLWDTLHDVFGTTIP
jgi:thiol-disulfide isomerase/thioredoxin